ncbi:type II and III secretion system protein family protein [Paraburkholderia unamae]|uniref:Type IV pilus biogenesis and competence protein PilQ n=1 Tax=Paraburkholderia unamae TaxID=219649 RepID=A0ABX5KRD3_9BURK|nr:pilus assembly protein N-terminal domain-containing protein [Paraburkholderia unamae]PVX84428.1 pilus assembly protein CpaC [Paraburkholderia unamae]CAG9248030.1 Type IV pilus biogenesis and competence protein PilQ [Paraburkholderia unamae]
MTIERKRGTRHIARGMRLFCAMSLVVPSIHGHAEGEAVASGPVFASAAVASPASAVPASAVSAPQAAQSDVAPEAARPPAPALPPATMRRVKYRPAAAAPDADDAVVEYAQGTPSTLYLYKGEVKVIPVPGRVKRVAVGNGDVVNASVVDHQLLLLAQQSGDTSLVVWNESGIALRTKISVSEQDRATTLSRLQHSLGFVEDLRIDADGNRFVVRGKVHPEQKDLVKAALAGLPDVVNLIEPDDGASLKKTVHFKMDILEISKTAERNLGIAWDQQINGPQASVAGNAIRTGRYKPFPDTGTAVFDNAPSMAGGAASGAFLGIATSIFSKINLLVDDGDAYILASPELNSRSGGKATFLSGGEVPIPVSAGFGAQDVIYKEYGIRLEIAPTVDAHNIISTDLLTEISQIDPTVQVQGYPAFITRRTTSQLSVRPGETLALAGLINADASTAIDKMPLLGDLPVLGHLFKSTDFRNNKSDLIVLVTPYIVDADSEKMTELTTNGSDIQADYRSEYGNPSPLPDANARREQALREEEEKRARRSAVLPAPDETNRAMYGH